VIYKNIKKKNIKILKEIMDYPDFFKLCKEWTPFFYSTNMEKILITISEELKKESEKNKIYPDRQNIFRCFYMTPFLNISVVMIGHEPYHNGSATGLCFDVKPGNIVNPSLQNIYKELEDEGFHPTKDGCLDHWATQGILFLNSALTVRAGEPDSHIALWSDFFQQVLEKLSEKNEIVWVLMGEKALEYKSNIIHPRHIILETAHPSAHMTGKVSKQRAFLGSGLFREINRSLDERGLEKISW